VVLAASQRPWGGGKRSRKAMHGLVRPEHGGLHVTCHVISNKLYADHGTIVRNGAAAAVGNLRIVKTKVRASQRGSCMMLGHINVGARDCKGSGPTATHNCEARQRK
jgi:hypothetical protein